MQLNNFVIVVLLLFVFTACTTTFKKSRVENQQINIPSSEEENNFFVNINSTDSNILKTCNKIVIILNDKKKNPIEITDPTSLTNLILLFNNAEPAADHMCGPVAKLKIISGNSAVLFDLLPGHKNMFYEFRYGMGSYKINREKFLKIKEIKEFKNDLLFSDL